MSKLSTSDKLTEIEERHDWIQEQIKGSGWGTSGDQCHQLHYDRGYLLADNTRLREQVADLKHDLSEVEDERDSFLIAEGLLLPEIVEGE